MKALARTVAAGAMVVLMVFGFTLPAQAATYQYWSGNLIERQIKRSATTNMNGGSVSLLNAPIYTVKSTVSGVGSFYGQGSISYTHALTNTSMYCQWYFSLGDGDIVHTTCKYYR